MFGIFDKPYADPVRLPLANGPVPILFILSTYLIFVLKLGPQFMSNRKPFQLRGVLKIYNLMQILFNSLLLMKCIHFSVVDRPYDFNCLMVLPPEHELKYMDRLLVYLYYINKIIDLMDTVFFVLRKSYKQITLLHLIHHVYMASSSYFLIRFYGYGGHVIVTGHLNLFVHIVMYSYYYLSSQSPLIKQSLWWKQYITIIQMIQFLCMFGHSLWTLMQPNCGIPRVVIYLVMFMSALMFVMFSNFYRHAYIQPNKKMAEKRQN